jgi:hypothetical protein
MHDHMNIRFLCDLTFCVLGPIISYVLRIQHCPSFYVAMATA